MGGRGAISGAGGSGGGAGIKSTYSLTDYEGRDMGRLVETNNGLFFQSSTGRISELPPETTLQGYLDRVTQTGGTTHKMTQKELKAEAKKNADYRKEIDAFLDKETANNKSLSKGSKMSAKGNRANRRR